MVRAWIGPRPEPGADRAPDLENDADALLADALIQLGGRSVHLSDLLWVTHLPAASDLPDDPAEVAKLLERLSGVPGVSVELDWQEHADWAELWKVGLEPRRVGSRFLVTPSWHEAEVRAAAPADDDLLLVLDPGLAFGNAEHGTTRGCLRLLEGVVLEGDRILDVGAGSGVLSIACAQLGAARCLAVEGDELAIDTARENAERNGTGDRVEVRHAHVDSADIAELGAEAGGFDGVICNIEGHLLAPLLEGLLAATRPGGWLLLSGILDDQWAWFEASVTDGGATRVAVDADGEWRSGLFRRRRPAVG